MPSTVKWGLWYPEGSDRVRPASNDFKMMQSSADSAMSIVEAKVNKYVNGEIWRASSGVGRAATSYRPSIALDKAVQAGAARVLVMGDSKSEGVGASAESKRWQGVLRKLLRERLFGNVGDQGVGYVPCLYAFDPGWDMTPKITGEVDEDWRRSDYSGLGERGLIMRTTNCKVSFPAQKARHLRVWYSKDMTDSGSFRVLVNGDEKGTYSSAGASVDGPTYADIDLGSVQSCEVVFECTVAGAHVNGVEFRTDTRGLSWCDAAHSGWRADLYDRSRGSKPHFEALRQYDPHLVIVALGSNDMAGNWGLPITAQEFATFLKSVYEKIVDKCPNAGVLFLHAPLRLEDAAPNDARDYPGKLEEFETVVRNTLANLPRAGILYESALWSPTQRDPQDSLGWLADRVHPSDFGHRNIAYYLANHIAVGERADLATVERRRVFLEGDVASSGNVYVQRSGSVVTVNLVDVKLARGGAVDLSGSVRDNPGWLGYLPESTVSFAAVTDRGVRRVTVGARDDRRVVVWSAEAGETVNATLTFVTGSPVPSVLVGLPA